LVSDWLEEKLPNGFTPILVAAQVRVRVRVRARVRVRSG
jgi:hypothetical protein